ncbi:MAG: ion transporter [Bacteroidaceae bacterium]|nr:ion transporter [Bacteroidaceae bacterium]
MLERINNLVNYSLDDKRYDWYDWVMIAVVFLSLIPLTTHNEYAAFKYIDYVTTAIFVVDYIIRWSVAKYSSKHKDWRAYALYPFRVSAIIDLLSILPIFLYLVPSFKVLRSWRVIRLLRVGRLFRYYDPLQVIIDVFRKKAEVLLTVVCFAVFYILITALIMFNVEYESTGDSHFFDTYWDAVYWATCTLTTVGYGDIYPVSAWGRAISMISAVVGIAIIALPSGILTAGYMDEMNERKKRESEEATTLDDGKAR